MALLQDPPLWLVLLGILAAIGLAVLFWRGRSSLGDLDRRGHPSIQVRDRSARHGPQTRVREWIDPTATGRNDEPSASTDRDGGERTGL